MSKPCDFGICNTETCSDQDCIDAQYVATVSAPAVETIRHGYNVNKSHNRVDIFTFDANGKQLGVVSRRIHRSGLPRGTREVWATSILKEYGFDHVL